MKRYTHRFTIERLGAEIDIEVEYAFDRGSPGKTYGPPEQCYPPEASELEIERAWVLDEYGKRAWEIELSDEEITFLIDTINEDQEFYLPEDEEWWDRGCKDD